jgi:peptide deformylase
MALRPIIALPDPRLRLRSEPVGPVDEAVRALAADMLDTMYDAPGIGLAAIQVGVPKRLIVLDVGKSPEERRPTVLVDPEITWASEEKRVHEEGCLSIPDYYEEVERPDRIRSAIGISTGARWRWRLTAFWPPASSTRSTTWTACCSSTTCRS